MRKHNLLIAAFVFVSAPAVASESWDCKIDWDAASGAAVRERMPEEVRIQIGENDIDLIALGWSPINPTEEQVRFTSHYKIQLNNDLGLIAAHPVAENQGPDQNIVRSETVLLDKSRGDFQLVSLATTEMHLWLAGKCHREVER